MGKHFGNLQYLKGVTYYSLSPYELKPFKGLLNPGIPNFFKRYFEHTLYAGIPFFVTYLVYDHFNALYQKSLRKNPDDYKDDV